MSNSTKETKIDKIEPYEHIQIEISPNGKYLVTYNHVERSIVGWNVEDINEGKLKSDITIKINFEDNIKQICVSDDKKLAYIHGKKPGKLIFI
jgi:hypothetical protein